MAENNSTSHEVNPYVPANKTMKELTNTLRTAKKVLKEYDSNSLLTHQVSQTLKEVTETSQEMQEFLKLMNRKPNSLIFGDK